MEFVEAVRLVYHLANGMELAVDEETPRELQRLAQSQVSARSDVRIAPRKQHRMIVA